MNVRNGKIRRSAQVGERYGRLVVEEAVETTRDGNVFLCRCDCGGAVKVPTGRLRSGNTKSCGCISREIVVARNKALAEHGMTGTGVFRSWAAMMTRCFNEKQPTYWRYGGAGVSPCEYIKAGPQNLKTLIGDRPVNLTLDRIDNKLGYTCGQCEQCKASGWPMNLRWATRSDQSANRRFVIMLTHNGETLCLARMAKKMGCLVPTVRLRYHRGIRGDSLFSKTTVRSAKIAC